MADSDFDRFERAIVAALPAATLPLRPNDRLAAFGLTDSLQLVQLVVHIEEALGIDLPDETLTTDTFETIGTLWGVLSAHLRPARP
ncbi:phosphopantetheine-binding protein [Dactylosporangium sp. CA-233914]|uniref:phosphopantetheine-binding protein n=1 Tax=Dactylosporangium sp. CA-233914 TaxID=3239934 RepID=UPI003D8B0D9A